MFVADNGIGREDTSQRSLVIESIIGAAYPRWLSGRDASHPLSCTESKIESTTPAMTCQGRVWFGVVCCSGVGTWQDEVSYIQNPPPRDSRDTSTQQIIYLTFLR